MRDRDREERERDGCFSTELRPRESRGDGGDVTVSRGPGGMSRKIRLVIPPFFI